MSLQNPPLLCAVFALACRSALTQGVEAIGGTNTGTLITFYHSLGLRGLSEVLSGRAGEESLIATSLMLCLGEIYAGGDQSSAWAVHLQGAKALMAAKGYHSSEISTDQREVLSLLNHLFLGIVVQAGLRYDQECYDWLSTTPLSSGEYFIDEWLGFSTELIPIFQSICQAVRKSPQASYFEGEALLKKIATIQSREERSPPQLRPSLQACTSRMAYRQFLLSNLAYRCAAKIHIYRRLLGLPSTADEVQNAVQEILRCVQEMIQGEGCRPWITMVMPVFTAGCEAQYDGSRAIATASLRRLEKAIGAGNIRHVRKVMEKVWDVRCRHTPSATMLVWSPRTSKSASYASKKTMSLTCVQSQ